MLMILAAALLAAVPVSLAVVPMPPVNAVADVVVDGPTGYNTLYSDAAPPERFQRPWFGRVLFTRDIATSCPFEVPPGYEIRACYRTDRVMVLPFPCPALRTDRLAWLACHEIGHANGWTATHED